MDCKVNVNIVCGLFMYRVEAETTHNSHGERKEVSRREVGTVGEIAMDITFFFLRLFECVVKGQGNDSSGRLYS